MSEKIEVSLDYLKALLGCVAVLDHAVELGYFNEGSTASMAKEALEKLEELKCPK